MANYAKTVSGVITRIIDEDTYNALSPRRSVEYGPVADSITIGMLWDGEEFVAPPTPEPMPPIEIAQ